MVRLWRAPRALALLLVAGLTAACAAPPNKEMDQAQGAIDAARAAGAERYAADEYQAAVAALKRSQEAVAQRDYRLALNHALDSRERAQNAAKQAADRKASVRSEAERRLALITANLAQLNGRLRTAEASRVPRRPIAAAREVLSSANESVRKAGAALAQEDYLAARDALTGVSERVRAAIREIDTATMAQTGRRRR